MKNPVRLVMKAWKVAVDCEMTEASSMYRDYLQTMPQQNISEGRMYLKPYFLVRN